MKDQSKWERIVKRWRESGLSQAAFCRQESIALSTFQYRKALLAKGDKKERFVEVGSEPSDSIEVVFPNGVKVCLPLEVASERVAELVQCLG